MKRSTGRNGERGAAVLSAVALAGLLGACGGEDEALETGQASLRWQVGARGCEAAGTPAVRVSLEGSWTNSDGVGVWVYDCSERTATVSGLRPGRYTFVVEALTPEGRAEYIGQTERIEVRPGGVAQPEELVLAAKPAVLTVQWDFGGPLCAHTGVEFVEVLGFDALGTVETEVAAACDDGGIDLSLRPGAHDVAVHGIDSEGGIRYSGVFTLDLRRGDLRVERVTLTPVQ